jgi:predicted RNase H-like HicB family nuclease
VHPFTAIYRRVPEGYVGYVAELPGAHTQGTTLDEARNGLREAARLVLEASIELSELEIAGADVIREPLELLV